MKIQLNPVAPRAIQIPTPAVAPARARWKTALKWVGLVLFTLGAMGVGAGLYLTHKFTRKSGFELIPAAIELVDTAFHPEEAFPGQRRITLLCMGLDRNWTRQGMPYTRNARTDTLMVASLDLERRAVSVISIPRDTWVPVPGTRSRAKINDAHARGGIPFAVKTVREFLGIEVDYYVVIKQEAIQGAIDQVGGLEVRVDKQMDYDDNWGQLHIHLRPGLQTLNGEQVVGYMRYRNDREGDFGRIRRQQQVVQLLTRKMKSPAIIFRMGELFDVLHDHVKTDLKRDQILALGKMFHHVEPQDLVTASLPGNPVSRGGASIVEPDLEKKQLLVHWLIHGDDTAGFKLTRVRVVNQTGDRHMGERAVEWLRALGFQAWDAGARRPQLPVSEALDHGSLPQSARRVLEALGIAGKVSRDRGRRTGGPDVTLFVGRDVAGNRYVSGDDLVDGMEAKARDKPSDPVHLN